MTRRVEDAEALLDELASVEVRRRLGAARWSQMTAEARSDADHWRQAVATAKAATRGIADRATLEDASAEHLRGIAAYERALVSLEHRASPIPAENLSRWLSRDEQIRCPWRPSQG